MTCTSKKDLVWFPRDDGVYNLSYTGNGESITLPRPPVDFNSTMIAPSPEAVMWSVGEMELKVIKEGE